MTTVSANRVARKLAVAVPLFLSLLIPAANALAGFDGPLFDGSPTGERNAARSVQATGPVPREFDLSQNFPNPFNPTTVIRYALPVKSHVLLTVHNLLGQVVATVINQDQEAGFHEIRFDAANLSSGVYLYRLEAGKFIETRKLTLVK